MHIIHTVLIQELLKWKGSKVYFVPLGGNNGDTLIEMGALEILKNQLSFEFVQEVNEASLIIINGSGDLSYHSENKRIEDTRQADILTSYPKIDVVLLPSSTTEINAIKLNKVISRREAKTILFARDPISFTHFQKILTAEVFLDHDMAFGLLDSIWFKEISKKGGSNYLLVVERFDAEGATNKPPIFKVPLSIRSLIPNKLKKILKRGMMDSIYSNSSFVKEAENKVLELFPELEIDNVFAADISLPHNYSFDIFVEKVAMAKAVVSTRLHVCILASILNKPCVAVQYEGGNKLLGVFEQSLKYAPNTKVWIRAKR